jgi:hypothetical protein
MWNIIFTVAILFLIINPFRWERNLFYLAILTGLLGVLTVIWLVMTIMEAGS